MAESPFESRPLLAQVPLAELAPHLSAGEHDGPADRTEVRRRASLSRVGKRSISLLFLGLGIMSMLALARAVVAASSNGLSVDDAMLLVMLGIISLVVASQVLSLLRTLPGTRRIWRRTARARQRRTPPTAGRPLLAQADARSLLDHMSTPPSRSSGPSRLRSVAGTVGWVVLTLVIMAAAAAGAAVVGLSAIGSINAHGWGLGTLLGTGMAALIGYGVTALSIGLIRSWFERRRRRLRRLLMRLLRYLLRGFDRSTASLSRRLGRFDGRTGLLGRGVLVTVGAAVVVAASTAIPVSAVGGTEANAAGPGTPTSTSASTSMTVGHIAVVEYETTPEFAAAGNPPEDGGEHAVPSEPVPAATTMAIDTTTAKAGNTTVTTVGKGTTTTTVGKGTTTTTVGRGTTTTTVGKGTTTTTVGRGTTTTTVADTTTTTVADTTTTTVADTTGPTVSRVSDSPDPIFTSGNPPDTSRISATTSDPSGVATVTVYYRLGKGGFVVWGSMKPGSSSTTFGPFATLGIYEYRIMATDTLGNANCKTPSSCPGGTVTVIIP